MTYSWEAMLRSCLGLALFQVICPVKVWTLVSCTGKNKGRQKGKKEKSKVKEMNKAMETEGKKTLVI